MRRGERSGRRSAVLTGTPSVKLSLLASEWGEIPVLLTVTHDVQRSHPDSPGEGNPECCSPSMIDIVPGIGTW